MTSIPFLSSNMYSLLQSSMTQKTSSAAPVDNVATSPIAKVSDAKPEEKPFSEVVTDARSALDEGYKNFAQPADFSTTEREWKSIGIEKLDRRTLFAISTNQGGLFSAVEVDAAKYFMSKQQEVATATADPKGTNPAALYKAGIEFLDNVSSEEKNSLEWAQSRAANQWGYEHHMRANGKKPENVDSDNLIVQLFVRAYNELAATNDASLDPRDMPSWLKATELWHLQNETSQQLSWTL